MTRSTLAALLLLSTLPACATLRPGPRAVDARERLELGIAAADSAEYTAAFEDLVWVYARCGLRETGRDALLALAALELDPRNPSRRLDVGSELAARHVRGPAAGDPGDLLAEVLYLLALERGATPPPQAQQPQPLTADTAAAPAAAPAPAPADVAGLPAPPADTAPAAIPVAPVAGDERSVVGCGALPRGEPRALPELPVRTVPALLNALRRERATVADSLSARIQALEQLLAEREQELARIRKTIKP